MHKWLALPALARLASCTRARRTRATAHAAIGTGDERGALGRGPTCATRRRTRHAPLRRRAFSGPLFGIPRVPSLSVHMPPGADPAQMPHSGAAGSVCVWVVSPLHIPQEFARSPGSPQRHAHRRGQDEPCLLERPPPHHRTEVGRLVIGGAVLRLQRLVRHVSTGIHSTCLRAHDGREVR